MSIDAFYNVSHLAHPPFHGNHVLRLVQRQTDSGSFHAAGDECCHHACVRSACLQQDITKKNISKKEHCKKLTIACHPLAGYFTAGEKDGRQHSRRGQRILSRSAGNHASVRLTRSSRLRNIYKLPHSNKGYSADAQHRVFCTHAYPII